MEFISLINKNIIITGTSRGIGYKLAKKFLKSNNYVWGCSKSKSKIIHKKYKHQIINLEKKSEINRWVAKVKKEAKNKVDILLLNAAFYERSLNYFDNDNNIIKTVMTNLVSSILISKKFSNTMIKKNEGMIVFFSSSATILNDIGTSSYSSSKAGLETFARILSKELKTFKISVYIFRINYIKTRISENLKTKKIKNLLSKFKTNIFSNTDKIYYKILKLSEKKLNLKEILVSDKIKR